mmetsp:Transcript_14285/g.20763  ORF Transcript_14285/g.20763 Transcript_14285/m.20763 type:complete len:177 (+) Transcript_14285:378-908(+)
MDGRKGLAVGVLVRIDGLKAAPQHNGDHGHLTIFNTETERWKVKLCAGGELGVKPANLEALLDGTIFNNGDLTVSSIQGRGYGMIALHDFKKSSVILQEKPLARVSKDTSVTAKKNPAAAALMNRVYEMASTGEFDATNPEEWPPQVIEILEQVMNLQADAVFSKIPALQSLYIEN